MASATETKGLALGTLFSLVIAKKVLRMTTAVSGLLLLALSIASFVSCYLVLTSLLANSVLGVRGTHA
jgi:ABC-type molybdate transport system permease subunit